MTVNQLISSKEIKIKEDIIDNFKLTKTLDIDASETKQCFNCGNKNNYMYLKSEPWTNVQWCWVCNHLNVIYVTDRMSGVFTDTVECYTNKD